MSKAYSALAGDGRVVQMPCGVRGPARMTASYPLKDVTVYDPLTLTPVQGFENLSFGQGQSMDLLGGPVVLQCLALVNGVERDRGRGLASQE